MGVGGDGARRWLGVVAVTVTVSWALPASMTSTDPTAMLVIEAGVKTAGPAGDARRVGGDHRAARRSAEVTISAAVSDSAVAKRGGLEEPHVGAPEPGEEGGRVEVLAGDELPAGAQAAPAYHSVVRTEVTVSVTGRAGRLPGRPGSGWSTGRRPARRARLAADPEGHDGARVGGHVDVVEPVLRRGEVATPDAGDLPAARAWRQLAAGRAGLGAACRDRSRPG